MERKKEKGICFFLCSSDNKKKKVDESKNRMYPSLKQEKNFEQNNKSRTTFKSSLITDEKRISVVTQMSVNENSVKNLNISKQYKSLCHIDFSFNDRIKFLDQEKSESIIDIDRKNGKRSMINVILNPTKQKKSNLSKFEDNQCRLLKSSKMEENVKNLVTKTKLDETSIREKRVLNKTNIKLNKQTEELKIFNSNKLKLSKIDNLSGKNNIENASIINKNKYENEKKNESPVDSNIKRDSFKLDELEEEMKENSTNEGDGKCQKSIISSKILSRINKPKSFSQIKLNNGSMSSNSELWFKLNNDSGYLMTNQTSSFEPQYLMTSPDISELEVIYDLNRIQESVNTPRKVNKSNPILKTLNETIEKMGRSIIDLKEKIAREKNKLKMYDLENENISKVVENEENENLKLRLILNYLLS